MRFTALWMFVGKFLAAAFLVTALPQSANATAQINWKLENPFRFFTDPVDTEVHRATYRALGPQEKLAPILSAERALQLRLEDGWASRMYRKTCWTAEQNRFTCPSYDDYMNPTNHTVIAELSGIDEAAVLTCTWLTAPKGGEDTRGKAVSQPCSEPVEFTVPYPEGLKISVEIGGREVSNTLVKVRDILVAAMGDSFGSGEGNPDIPVRFSPERAANYGAEDEAALSGYPARVGDWRQIGDKAFIAENARWLDQACHRSLYSNQLRAALQLAVEDPHLSVTFAGVACSGAEITDGLFLRYKGNEWVPNPPALSQISALAEAQCGRHETRAMDLPEAYHMKGRIPELKGGLVLRKCRPDQARKIDLLLLSIGGNDIGFSRLVANAVLSNESYLRQLGGWFGEVHGQGAATALLGRLDDKYKALNRAIHNQLYMPWDESDRIILTGYPGMALAGDGSETCKDGRAGLEVISDFQLSEQKLREGTWIGDKLHRQMRASAEEFGWTFVETHRRKFIGRGICSGSDGNSADPAEELRLPRKVDGIWTPYNPSEFRAYAPRQRWFRTPNDAFMTGNFHVAASLLQKVMKLDSLAWFQLLLASTYSGAFHPTAEGNAAIADAIADKARVVLQKHGLGPDPEPLPEYEQPAPPVEEPGASTGPDLGAGSAASGAAPAEQPPAASQPQTMEPDVGATKPDAADVPSAPTPVSPQ